MPKVESAAADHPSPHRDAVGLVPLFYGLIAAPCAWLIGQVACSTLAQEACFPGTEPLSMPAFLGVHALNTTILVLSVATSLSGALIAFRAWRRTRGEHAGDEHTLLEIGEGRSRFMAFAGVLSSLGFALATVFSVPALLFVSAC